MRSHHRKGLPMYQKLSQAIQIMHNGCMIMLAIIGYLIALLFFLTVGLSVACLSLVILILSTIQQKVLSRIFLKRIGSLCSEVVLALGLAYVLLVTNLLALCRILKCTMRRRWLIDKVVPVVDHTLLILMLIIPIFFFF